MKHGQLYAFGIEFAIGVNSITVPATVTTAIHIEIALTFELRNSFDSVVEAGSNIHCVRVGAPAVPTHRKVSTSSAVLGSAEVEVSVVKEIW